MGFIWPDKLVSRVSCLNNNSSLRYVGKAKMFLNMKRTVTIEIYVRLVHKI